MNTIHLDVSELAAPEPYALAIEALSDLPLLSVLSMTHRKEPFPLYQAADEMGFDHHTMCLNNSVVSIHFWHKGNQQAAMHYATLQSTD